MTEKVTEKEARVLAVLREKPDATYDEIAGELGVSRKTVSQKIRLLKEKGIIVRMGSAKRGYWRIPIS